MHSKSAVYMYNVLHSVNVNKGIVSLFLSRTIIRRTLPSSRVIVLLNNGHVLCIALSAACGAHLRGFCLLYSFWYNPHNAFRLRIAIDSFFFKNNSE